MHCFEFRPRGVVVPEILIYVAGAPRWITLGTRVIDVANEVFPLPRSVASTTGNAATDNALYGAWARRAWPRLKLRRHTWSGDADIVLSSDESAPAALSIPLIAGDSITW
jgi:hypothetical protein